MKTCRKLFFLFICMLIYVVFIVGISSKVLRKRMLASSEGEVEVIEDTDDDDVEVIEDTNQTKKDPFQGYCFSVGKNPDVNLNHDFEDALEWCKVQTEPIEQSKSFSVKSKSEKRVNSINLKANKRKVNDIFRGICFSVGLNSEFDIMKSCQLKIEPIYPLIDLTDSCQLKLESINPDINFTKSCQLKMKAEDQSKPFSLMAEHEGVSNINIEAEKLNLNDSFRSICFSVDMNSAVDNGIKDPCQVMITDPINEWTPSLIESGNGTKLDMNSAVDNDIKYPYQVMLTDLINEWTGTPLLFESGNGTKLDLNSAVDNDIKNPYQLITDPINELTSLLFESSVDLNSAVDNDINNPYQLITDPINEWTPLLFESGNGNSLHQTDTVSEQRESEITNPEVSTSLENQISDETNRIGEIISRFQIPSLESETRGSMVPSNDFQQQLHDENFSVNNFQQQLYDENFIVIEKNLIFQDEASTSSNGKEAKIKRACQNCGTTATTFWRGKNDAMCMCNACKLYLKLHHINRPSHLWNRKIIRRSSKRRIQLSAIDKEEKCMICGKDRTAAFSYWHANNTVALICSNCKSYHNRHNEHRPERYWHRKFTN